MPSHDHTARRNQKLVPTVCSLEERISLGRVGLTATGLPVGAIVGAVAGGAQTLPKFPLFPQQSNPDPTFPWLDKTASKQPSSGSVGPMPGQTTPQPSPTGSFPTDSPLGSHHLLNV